MKKIILYTLLTMLILFNACIVSADSNLVIFNYTIENVLVDSNDVDVLLAFQKEAKEKMAAVHSMAEQARALGYPEDHPVIKLAGQEWTAAYQSYLYYQEQIDTLQKTQFNKKMDEYPAAAAVWYALTADGFTEEAAAAVIGNMMSECGHQTLDLNPTIWNNAHTHYGLCQWSSTYYPEVSNSSLETQINFLLKTVPADIKTMTDIKAATVKFAKDYERCSSSSYEKRKTNAVTAYDYFMANDF